MGQLGHVWNGYELMSHLSSSVRNYLHNKAHTSTGPDWDGVSMVWCRTELFKPMVGTFGSLLIVSSKRGESKI